MHHGSGVDAHPKHNVLTAQRTEALKIAGAPRLKSAPSTSTAIILQQCPRAVYVAQQAMSIHALKLKFSQLPPSDRLLVSPTKPLFIRLNDFVTDFCHCFPAHRMLCGLDGERSLPQGAVPIVHSHPDSDSPFVIAGYPSMRADHPYLVLKLTESPSPARKDVISILARAHVRNSLHRRMYPNVTCLLGSLLEHAPLIMCTSYILQCVVHPAVGEDETNFVSATQKLLLLIIFGIAALHARMRVRYA